MTESQPLPRVVSAEEWQQARDELLKTEKEATGVQDALAARRRRLPMMRFASDYVFNTPDGEQTLLELFEVRTSPAPAARGSPTLSRPRR